MNSEFVKLLNTEVTYSKKNFLNSELELLNTIKSLRNYRDLRKEEFVLKITLKNKIAECLTALHELEKRLPKTDYNPEKTNKEDKEEVKKKLSLQEEIEQVRRKLEKLQEEM